MNDSITDVKRVVRKWRAILLMAAILSSGLTGCSVDVFYLPERDATVQEAFSNLTPPSDPAVARDAVVSKEFNAPYEDVYRAVSVASTQALFHVKEENKRAGVVLATERVERWRNSPEYVTYFHAILVKERGPRRTSVTVLSKVQVSCKYEEIGAGIHIATFGIMKIAEAADDPKGECQRLSTVRWLTGFGKDGISSRMPERERFLSFIRNNLVAAGAL